MSEPPRLRIISLLHNLSVVFNEYCYLILADRGKRDLASSYPSFEDFFPPKHRKLKSCPVLGFLTVSSVAASTLLVPSPRCRQAGQVDGHP